MNNKIKRVEEEQVMKDGTIIAINYSVWYFNAKRRDYRHGHYKVIPMTVLNFILDENNEARTRYQEFGGNTYKRTTYQQPQEAPQEAPAAEAEQQHTETENAPQAATQAAEGIEITAITYTTDDDPDPAPGLLIHRPGTTSGIIIGDGVMLPDDPTDLLTAYGEREYSRDAAGNYIITTDEKKEEENTMSNTPFTPAEAAQHAATVAGIIRRKGGYRERDIINHPHTVERGTWTTEHKVVEILSTTPEPDGYRPGCAVDIVTRSIVG